MIGIIEQRQKGIMDPHMGLLYPFAITKFARNVTKNELNNKKTL